MRSCSPLRLWVRYPFEHQSKFCRRLLFLHDIPDKHDIDWICWDNLPVEPIRDWFNSSYSCHHGSVSYSRSFSDHQLMECDHSPSKLEKKCTNSNLHQRCLQPKQRRWNRAISDTNTHKLWHSVYTYCAWNDIRLIQAFHCRWFVFFRF